MENYIYIHVCCINNWKQIFTKLLIDIKNSGLYDKVKKIKCNVLSESSNIDLEFFSDEKIEIIGINNINAREPSTLNLMYKHAFNEDFNVLYIHTKGVTHNNANQCVTDWVTYLSYFNIYKHQICIEQLKTYDTVGVNLQEKPNLHYSGNFWWSTSQYIRKLQECKHTIYNSPEFWLTENKNGMYLSLWNSNINHYNERYEEHQYKNKPIYLDTKTRKIIDCFTFYNELELLTYRLNIFDDIVDFFILVEATLTFSGKEKPLFYNENKHLFTKFHDKIIHIIVDDLPHTYPTIKINENMNIGEQWKNEKYQRNCISRGLQKINIKNEDVIVVADLDEFPDPKILVGLKQNMFNVEIAAFEMDMYYYNLNTKLLMNWHHCKMITYKKYKELNISCEEVRFSNNIPVIKNGGWHLSYFGDSKFIKNKIETFSHQEFNNDHFTSLKKIEHHIQNFSDLFDRDGTKLLKIPTQENNYLPPEYETYLKNFFVLQKPQEAVEDKQKAKESVEGIILILSCQKHKNTRLKEFSLPKKYYSNWKVIYVIGDFFLDKKYTLENELLTVRCEDSYLHLLKKFGLCMKYLYENFEIKQGILRSGDDLIFNESNLEQFLNSKNKHDFYGSSPTGMSNLVPTADSFYPIREDFFMVEYYRHHPEDFDNPQHNLKGVDVSTYVRRPKIPIGPAGVLYYISNKSCHIIIDHLQKFDFDIYQFNEGFLSYPYLIEDTGVSFILYLNNIGFLHSNTIYSDNINHFNNVMAIHTNKYKY